MGHTGRTNTLGFLWGPVSLSASLMLGFTLILKSLPGEIETNICLSLKNGTRNKPESE